MVRKWQAQQLFYVLSHDLWGQCVLFARAEHSSQGILVFRQECEKYPTTKHSSDLLIRLLKNLKMLLGQKKEKCPSCRLNLISGQNDFNLGWFVISLSLFMIMNTRDKEITNQPRLKSFWPGIKFNLQHPQVVLYNYCSIFQHQSWKCCQRPGLVWQILRERRPREKPGKSNWRKQGDILYRLFFFWFLCFLVEDCLNNHKTDYGCSKSSSCIISVMDNCPKIIFHDILLRMCSNWGGNEKWLTLKKTSTQVEINLNSTLAILLGLVVRSLVSANRWLRGIKTYRFPWYLTLVSANHASSNPGLFCTSTECRGVNTRPSETTFHSYIIIRYALILKDVTDGTVSFTKFCCWSLTCWLFHLPIFKYFCKHESCLLQCTQDLVWPWETSVIHLVGSQAQSVALNVNFVLCHFRRLAALQKRRELRAAGIE